MPLTWKKNTSSVCYGFVDYLAAYCALFLSISRATVSLQRPNYTQANLNAFQTNHCAKGPQVRGMHMNVGVRSFEMIWINDPRSQRSWCIKGTDESTLITDLSVPLTHHGLSDPGSLILIQIIPKERTLYSG